MEFGIPNKYLHSTDLLEDGSNVSLNDVLVESINLVTRHNWRKEPVAVVAEFGFAVENFKVEEKTISYRGSFRGAKTGITYVYDIAFIMDGIGNTRGCSADYCFVTGIL